MSFEINGSTWEPKTATEHAEALLTKINQILADNNITDEEGNIVQLKQNYGNAMWLLNLGNGNRFADNDAKLSKAINSFNIELCDDQQIENLLPIAAVTRNEGSYSTLTLTCYASEDGDCTIPEGTLCTAGDAKFAVDTTTVISAGSYAKVATTCTTVGPVAVLTGEVTSFDTDIGNLDHVVNEESSIPGVAQETTSELRQRLISGNTMKYSLEGCKSALEELTGVTYARVYFNYNNSATLTLPGGVVLQPRTAYIVVHGSSDKIAETYAEFMNAPTQNSPIGAGTYSTVDITITAGDLGAATLPAGTSATYQGYTFETSEQVVVPQGTSEEVRFTCTQIGPVTVPTLGIQELNETIENLESAQNLEPAIPGTNDPKHSQDWITSSGQVIPIKYDDASELNIFVKVFLASDAEVGPEVETQIATDLILASASWEIGEPVTQLSTSKPFVDCTYTKVAYTKVSTDGNTWQDLIEVGCNVIPRVSDATIEVEQIVN